MLLLSLIFRFFSCSRQFLSYFSQKHSGEKGAKAEVEKGEGGCVKPTNFCHYLSQAIVIKVNVGVL